LTKPVIVADAGPLIALAKCGQLALLSQAFGHIHLVRAVLREGFDQKSGHGFVGRPSGRPRRARSA